MAYSRALFFGLCLTALACGENKGGNVGLNGDCVDQVDCREPYVCRGADLAKKCTIEAPKVCSKGTTRCVGAFVQTCNDLETAWLDNADACATGCGMVPTSTPGELVAGCKPEFCKPGSSRCASPNVVVKCDEAGSAEYFFRSCVSGCVADGDQADCAAQRCRPYETSCKAGDPGKLLTCDSRGAQTVETTCPEVGGAPSICIAGRCAAQVCTTTTTGGTTSRQERCNGAIREECNDNGTAWRAIEVCSLGCNFDSQTNDSSCAQASCKLSPTDEPAGPYASVCDPADASGVQLLTCDERGAQWVRFDCSTMGPNPHVCVGGACVAKACSVERNGAGEITARAERCNGFQIERCADTQANFEPAGSACEFGCEVSAAGRATCSAPQCTFSGGGTAAQTTCVGNSLQRCNSAGVFAHDRFCPSGCVVGTNGVATCAQSLCTPLARECRTDTTGAFVRICKSDGTGHEILERCPQGCEGNRCTVTDDTCAPGSLRCAGTSSQLCVALPNGATEWRYLETCLDGCVAGVCNGTAACGCEGSSQPPAVECGTGTRLPITLSVIKDADDAALPCDGNSTFLVLTAPIKSATGTTVPDGTLVTFTPAGSGTAAAIIVSADADATRPGLQRPTRNGVARVVVEAPETCTGPLTQELRASVGTDCGGSLTLTFNSFVDTGDGVPAYLAEDFSTIRVKDPIRTEADWNPQTGLLSAAPIFSTGTGRDGDILIGTGASGSGTAVVDLADRGYARSVEVVRVGTADVTTPTNLPPFAPGDEALLFTQWSSSADDVGRFEFKTVASIATGRVIFTTPIENVYAPSAEISGRRVMLLRVPHFGNVTILGNGQLTTAAPTGTAGNLSGGSGVLAFRATGTVSVQGIIDMQNRGLPAGVSHTGGARPNQSIPRLIIGSGTGSAGGGAVFIAAGKLSHMLTATTVPAAPDGTIRAGSTSGFGGIVWTSSGELAVGTAARSGQTFHIATSGTPGQNGAIRTDYISTDAGSVHWANPVPFRGQSAGFSVTSTIARTVTPLRILEMALLGGFGGIATDSIARAPGLQYLPDPANPPIPMVGTTVDVSAASGSTWQPNAELGAAITATGASPDKFMWRIGLKPLTGRPLELGGLAFRMILE